MPIITIVPLARFWDSFYIFYDSSGKALYVGQTKKQKLWNEINGAYNRYRRNQEIYLVKHIQQNKEYNPVSDTQRKPRITHVKLFNLAAYLSVYKVEPGLIDNLEAILIRTFPNDLWNAKIQRLGKGQRDEYDK